MDEPLSLLRLVAAVAAAVGFALLLRRVVRRRLEQAVAVARAEAETARAKVEERLALREEALAEARAAAAEAAAKLDAAVARESELRARLVESETRLAEEREQAAEKLALVADNEKRLAESFANLAGRALEANAESFLRQAKQSFETLQASAAGDLEQRRQAVEAMLGPIREQLAKYDSGVRELERAREQAYGTLSEQVRAMLSTQDRLQTETGNLVKALRAPQVRGRWGEMTLKRAVEFAGLVDHVDFVEQATVAGDEATLRPDLVVNLPGGKKVVVDAKAPLAAYLEAVEARDEDARLRHLADHARQVRDHVRKLAAKSYWSQFDEAPDFVVLFLPGETFFAAALEHDPQLIDDAFGESVVLATPTTLVALLKSIAYGWRQEQLARNAREIAGAARELHERVRVFSEHFATVGRGLAQALKGYNSAAGSLSSRVFPQGRRLEELGAGGGKPLAEPEPIDAAPRELTAGDGGEPPPASEA
jgi:DNA recombination protein RmuC